MKATFLLLSLSLLCFTVPARADVTFADLFHLTPTEVERSLGAERLKMLQDAAEDFNAVLKFKPPVHALFDQEAPLPADGGTEFYRGNGYRLTVRKSLFTLGVANPYDNARMESFWATLETELIRAHVFASRAEAKMCAF